MRRFVFFALIVSILLIAVLFCYVGVYLNLSNYPGPSNDYAAVVYKREHPRKIYYREKEEILLGFIEKHLMGDNGEIYTMTNSSSHEEDGVTLSESVGLMMTYCVLRNRKDMFDRQYNFLRDKLLVENSYVKWKNGESISCNAAIDDFRILRALLDAYELWGDSGYFNTAGLIQEAIFRHQASGGKLLELYDWARGETKPRIPLCYIDLYTMRRLGVFKKKWLSVMENGISTVKSGRISMSVPFFYKYFDYNGSSYSLDEEYAQTGGICLTYTLYTILHLAEVEEDTDYFTAWLASEMDSGRLYARYNPCNLEPASDVESTAIYALAAVYADLKGDKKLYYKLLDRMLKFMVDDAESPYFGGFGNAESGEFYSFDNLMALWALALAG